MQIKELLKIHAELKRDAAESIECVGEDGRDFAKDFETVQKYLTFLNKHVKYVE